MHLLLLLQANADSFAAEEDPPLSSAVMDGDNPTTGTPPEAASAPTD